MKTTTFVGSACLSTLFVASTCFAGLPPVTNGLYLQLEADSIGAADGATVTGWTDTVGSQVFSGSATYVADWNLSGHAALSFDSGLGDMMSATLSGAPAMNDMTMIAFGTWRDDVQTYYDYMTSGTGTDRARIFEDRGSIGARIDNSGTAQSGFSVLGYGDSFAIAVRASGGSYLDMWVADEAGNFDWYGSSTASSSSSALPKLNLAANDAGTEFSDVDIAEVLIYAGGLGSGDIHTITDALHLKYAPIPEPSTFALLMGGLGVLIASRFRRA